MFGIIFDILIFALFFWKANQKKKSGIIWGIVAVIVNHLCQLLVWGVFTFLNMKGDGADGFVRSFHELLQANTNEGIVAYWIGYSMSIMILFVLFARLVQTYVDPEEN